ncbi:hypothetical protein AJ88_15695 [Mesorhizobium amorphae CCBAU 01583]|nr:hypothetical protein AJ88_15695 [Mesorhizobium amorphae CCBAU 01583]
MERKRIFHTESKPKLDLYAAHSNLALVMTAMHDDIQFVVGVACAVRENSKADLVAIAKNGHFKNTLDEMWEAESVRRHYPRRSVLREDFPKGFNTPRWRCPNNLFLWFRDPISLPRDPLGLGREVLAKMHNNYQAIRPEHALLLLNDRLGDDSPIRAWLVNKEFDEAFLSPRIRRTPGQSTGQGDKTSGPRQHQTPISGTCS